MSSSKARQARRQARRQQANVAEVKSFKLMTYPRLSTMVKNDLILCFYGQKVNPELSKCRIWFEETTVGDELFIEGTAQQAHLAQHFLAGITFARNHTMEEMFQAARSAMDDDR